MSDQNYVFLCPRLAVMLVLSLLAACGGKSEKEEACDQAAAGYFPVLNGIKCLFGEAKTDFVQKPGPDSSVVANDDGSYGHPSVEYEPNTTLDNANSLVVNGAATTIEGGIGWNGDVADNFVFSPIRTGDYHFSLCEATCDNPINEGALSLSVLDQSQTTIASTSAGLPGEKSLSIRLNAGVAYYAAVNSYGTAGNYRLVIVKSEDGG